MVPGLFNAENDRSLDAADRCARKTRAQTHIR
jgi:hypothetical protein